MADTLDYTTQAILNVNDEKLSKSFGHMSGMFKATFNDVSKSIKSWADKDEKSQSKILNELSDLNGRISGLPSSFTNEVDRVLIPLNKVETSVSTMAAALPAIADSLSSMGKAVSSIEELAREHNILLGRLNDTVDSPGPNPTGPVPDYTPNYSDNLNDLYSVITDIRSSIEQGFNLDASDFYPDLRDDLSGISDAINGLVDANLSGEGLDLDSFTSDVVGLVQSVSESLVTSFAQEVAPGMAEQFGEFVVGFTESFEEAFRNNPPQPVLDTDVQLSPESLGDLPDILNGSFDELKAFHADTDLWLTNIDERLTNGFTTVSNTVSRTSSRSDRITSRGFSDEIDSFDDIGNDTDKISIFSEFGKNALDMLNSEVTDLVVGVLSFKWVATTIDDIHKDTTDIMQATGLSRVDASKVSSAVYKGVYDRFGRDVFGTEEIENAMQSAISSGMVNAQTIQEASQSMLVASKIIPGVMLDFSDGWAKQFMTVQGQGGAYIESTAMIVDDLSNKFYVSAQTLEKSVGTYSKAAALFSSDVKSYTKSMNAYLKRVAAEEEAGIANLGITEFLDRIAWTSMDQLTDTDFARLSQQFGVTGGADLMQFKADMRGDNGTAAQQAAWDRAMANLEISGTRDLTNFQKGGVNAELTLMKYNQLYGQGGTDVQNTLEAIKNGRIEEAREAAKSAGETDYSQEEAAERAKEMANNTIEQNVVNIAHSLTRDGVIGDALTKISNLGIGGGIAGFASGILGSFTSGLARKGLGKIFGSITGGGGGGGLLAGLGKGATAAGEAASAAGTAATSAATAAGTAAEAAGTAATAAGTAGTGIIARLGTFFGKTGAKVSTAATKATAAATKMGKATADFTKTAGTKMGELAGKASNAASNAGTKAGELAGKISNTKFGGVLQNLLSPANAKVAAYGGRGAGLVKAIGSKANVGLAIGQTVLDLGMGAHKAEEWVGDSDATSTIASGIAGALGGGSGEGGVGNALKQGAKWAAIGTAIAPGIGTAIGAIAGGIAGGIGAEKIAQKVDSAFNWIGEKNDQLDLLMEEKLGGFGHALSAMKNTFGDFWKNIGGGLFKGLGDIVGGVKDGVSDIFHGNFKEGFKTLGSGFLNAGKNIVGGVKDAATDIWDDWTLSAEERINKRKKDVEDLSKAADKAEDKLNKKDEDLTQAARDSASDIVHTGESIFTSNADKGRYGTADASGLNSYGYADYSAAAISSTPINHGTGGLDTVGALTENAYSNIEAVAWKTAYDNVNSYTEAAVLGARRAAPATVTAEDVHGPIISDINSAGPENISSPIVNALNTNMDSVVMLLEQAVRLLGNGGNLNGIDRQLARAPVSFGSKETPNSTQIMNYQNLA